MSFLQKAPSGALATTKRSVYMTLPFVDFKRVLEAQRARGQKAFRAYVQARVLSIFETQVRMQSRHRVEQDRGHVVDAQELFCDSALMSDLEAVLRRYQLAESEIPVVAELIRLKLQLKYLVGSVDSEEAP